MALIQLDLLSLELSPLHGLPSSSTGPECWCHLAVLCQPLESLAIPVGLFL